MSRTSVFTSITPLPSGITRQSVMDAYHNHVEMIELNPLVVERFQCKPPSYSPKEEMNATWYTIKDKVSYLPGGLATGSVSYHACFHDLAEGLQTHVYAPLGLDIRAKWTVGGSLPGEPKEAVELGLKVPATGLYIREDVRMKCNIMMMGFVKKTFKESHAKLVDRLVEKAHIMESEAANRRLKMLKNLAPGDRSGHGSIFILPPPGYQDQQYEQQRHQETHQYSDQHHPEHVRPETNNPPQYLPAPAYSSHQSVYSSGSNQSPIHSPGSSINTASHSGGSSYLTSPPHSSASSQRHSHHRHSHSQDCDHHLRLDAERHNIHDDATLSEQEKLERQITYLLPPTRYDPHLSPITSPFTSTHSPSATAADSSNPLQLNPPTPPQYTLLPAVAYNPHAGQLRRSKSQSRPRAWTEGSLFQSPGAPPNMELPGPPVPPKNHIIITELPARLFFFSFSCFISFIGVKIHARGKPNLGVRRTRIPSIHFPRHFFSPPPILCDSQ